MGSPSVQTLFMHVGGGLNLYQFLAPNAYPQLRDHVDVTNSTVISQVYDVSLFGYFCLCAVLHL